MSEHKIVTEAKAYMSIKTAIGCTVGRRTFAREKSRLARSSLIAALASGDDGS